MKVFNQLVRSLSRAVQVPSPSTALKAVDIAHQAVKKAGAAGERLPQDSMPLHELKALRDAHAHQSLKAFTAWQAGDHDAKYAHYRQLSARLCVDGWIEARDPKVLAAKKAHAEARAQALKGPPRPPMPRPFASPPTPERRSPWSTEA